MEPQEKLDWHCLKHHDISQCKDECKVQKVLHLLGKKYTMPIIRYLLLHYKLRFNEIMDLLNGSPKTITLRLRGLERHGLIKRVVHNESPIRVEYSLTKKGRTLQDIFERFARWALENDL